MEFEVLKGLFVRELRCFQLPQCGAEFLAELVVLFLLFL